MANIEVFHYLLKSKHDVNILEIISTLQTEFYNHLADNLFSIIQANNSIIIYIHVLLE